MESMYDVDKLSYQIFSALERRFLFGNDDTRFSDSPPGTPFKPTSASSGGGRRVRILSIDSADGGILAAFCLARLEESLRRRSGNPAAYITDFFDIAAGSGAGGLLASMTFTRGSDGSPLFSAEEALGFFVRNRKRILEFGRRKGVLRAAFRRRPEGIFRRIFGDSTLRDTVKPVLIPCYDLTTGAPFVFSRADAVEADGFDFKMSDVCAATCADPGAGKAAEISSVDGHTRIAAVGGGLALGNPAAAAVTHVLNNRREFPRAAGVDDVILVSLGGGIVDSGGFRITGTPTRAHIVGISGREHADLVDQSLAMAFAKSKTKTTNYVRIQANWIYDEGIQKSRLAREDPLRLAEEVLAQKNVESILFIGRKQSEQTNTERLEWIAGELAEEHESRRSGGSAAVVTIRQSITPRTSSATTVSTAISSGSASPRS